MAHSLKFLDLNTFYGPKAGGIRTYHQAKMDWFTRQTRHDYVLAYPGTSRSTVQPNPKVRLITLPGPALTPDPDGYRLLWNPISVAELIAEENPDIVEVGDPWVTGPIVLALHRLGRFKGIFSHFYHSDPIPSYFEAWARKGRARWFKTWLAALAGMGFYRMQKQYPLTVTSSRVMQASLQRQGLGRVAFLPFGVDARYFAAGTRRLQAKAILPENGRRLRVLYAGRLDSEKGWDILLPLLPTLLVEENLEITIAGRGRFAKELSAIRHERYRFLGFVNGAEAMENLYAESDVLLAPGPYETFGLGVLEAMASGLPVIAPNQGGSGELLTEARSPLCFQAHNRQSLSDTLRLCHALWREDGLRDLASQQFDLATRYGTWDDAMSRLMGYYEECHASGRRF